MKKFYLLLLLALCLTSCKKINNHLDFCQTVNVKRDACDPKANHYCDQVMSVAKPAMVAQIRACPYETPPDVFVLSDPYPEMGAAPCCLPYTKPALKK